MYTSVIINNLPKETTEKLFHPNVPWLGDDGEEHYRQDGTLCTSNWDPEKHEPIDQLKVHKWTTPKALYEGLKEQTKTIINAIKLYVNNTDCAVTYHDGEADPGCKFHGKHLHIFVYSSSAVCKDYTFRKLRGKIEGVCEVKTETVKHPEQFGKYMRRDPRIYLGSNCEDLMSKCIPETAEELRLAQSETKKTDKKPQLYKNIDAMILLMKKYDTIDSRELFELVHNTDDQDQFLNLYRDRNWTRIIKQATQEYQQQCRLRGEKYFDWFMRYEVKDTPRKKYLTVPQTRQLVYEWCREQNIISDFLIDDMYTILAMKDQKKNALWFHGKSNAGKTYMMSMLMPSMSMVGMHTTSREFPFGECVDKTIILITELTIPSPAVAEPYKQLMAGEEIQVNIKNKPSEKMERKPVLLQTNEVIWRFVASEKKAFENRTISYRNLCESIVAKRWSARGLPNPAFLQEEFRQRMGPIPRSPSKATQTPPFQDIGSQVTPVKRRSIQTQTGPTPKKARMEEEFSTDEELDDSASESVFYSNNGRREDKENYIEPCEQNLEHELEKEDLRQLTRSADTDTDLENTQETTSQQPPIVIEDSEEPVRVYKIFQGKGCSKKVQD